MCTKRKKKMIKNKEQEQSQFTGKRVSPEHVIDKREAIEYLKSLGYDVIKFRSPLEL